MSIKVINKTWNEKGWNNLKKQRCQLLFTTIDNLKKDNNDLNNKMAKQIAVDAFKSEAVTAPLVYSSGNKIYFILGENQKELDGKDYSLEDIFSEGIQQLQKVLLTLPIEKVYIDFKDQLPTIQEIDLEQVIIDSVDSVKGTVQEFKINGSKEILEEKEVERDYTFVLVNWK